MLTGVKPEEFVTSITLEPSATSNRLMPNQQRKGKKVEQVEPAEPAELAGSPEVTDAFHAEDAEVAHGEHPHAMILSTCEYMSMLNDIRNAVGYMDDLCVTTPCSRSTCWCLSACLRVTGAKLKASKVPPAAGTASSREVELWPHELSGTESAEAHSCPTRERLSVHTCAGRTHHSACNCNIAMPDLWARPLHSH